MRHAAMSDILLAPSSASVHQFKCQSDKVTTEVAVKTVAHCHSYQMQIRGSCDRLTDFITRKTASFKIPGYMGD
jgi:predicted small secreted protein